MRVIAVVPAYNEAKRIGAVVRGLLARVDSVVVIDDCSLDDTASVARSAGAEVLVHAVNRGQGAALKTGTVWASDAGADIIVHLDADGQHDPDTVPELLAPVHAGNTDVVFGSRFLGITPEGMPVSRRALLVAARAFNRFVLGIPAQMTDPQSGMRAMTAEAARQIDFSQDRMAHCSEILRLTALSGLRWVEVPVRVRYSTDTIAKGQKTTDALRIVWQLFLGAFQR